MVNPRKKDMILGEVLVSDTANVMIADSSAVTMLGLINNTTSRPVRIDALTHVMGTIEYEHYKIHEGNHYFVDGYSVLNSGQNVTFSVETPNTAKNAHMLFNVVGSFQWTFTAYEGAEIGTDGTATTPINSNRESANTSGLVVTKDPTVINTGTLLLHSARYGTLSGGFKDATTPGGGTASRANEMILARSGTYIYIMEAHTDGTIIDYYGHWYEQTPKN